MVMKEKETFKFTGRIRSMNFALEGIVTMIKGQHNAWVHCVSALCVIALALFCKVTVYEWCILIFSIAIVFITEALNTAFEHLCDVASPEFHPEVKKAKDIAAGAVLISAICSGVVGVIIFLPYILKLT